MTTASQDVRYILDGQSSLALEFGTDLFIGLMPETPNLCVSLADYSGMSPDPNDYFKPSFQVLVRGNVGEYDIAAELAESIVTVLHEYTGTPNPSGYFYAGIWLSGDITFLGVDELNRPLFSLNFRTQRRT